jgi:steroid 5-alpha reductase family enzyme
MAKVTIVFAILLIILGLVGFYGTGAIHHTALIPAWWGIAMGIFGVLAISPNEGRRKLFMHVNVTLGTLGFLGGIITAIQGYGSARSAGVDPDYIAMTFKLIMAGLLLIYVNFCIRSFIAARRARQD